MVICSKDNNLHEKTTAPISWQCVSIVTADERSCAKVMFKKACLCSRGVGGYLSNDDHQVSLVRVDGYGQGEGGIRGVCQGGRGGWGVGIPGPMV